MNTTPVSGVKPNFRYETIGPDADGQRVDNYVLRMTGRVPKALVYKWLRKKVVKVNGKVAQPSAKLAIGDVVQLPRYVDGVDQTSVDSSDMLGAGAHLISKLPVLYEDDGLIVIAKPSGLAVHGGSGVSLGVIEILRAAYPKQTFFELVHRLDRDTSGCLLVAKKRAVLVHLHNALREGLFEKRYIALLSAPITGEAVIDSPLHKFVSKTGERRVRIDKSLGKPSTTCFKVLESFEQATLVEARPLTGRTHQVRVHAREWCAPIVGDEKYADPQINARFKEWGISRLFLHAIEVEIPLLSGERKRIQCELPENLTKGLERLRRG